YEGTRIYTAYVNNVHMRFGQHLRRVINVILNLRQRKADRKRELIAQGLSPDQVRQDLYETITRHATGFKLAIARRGVLREDINAEPGFLREAYDILQPVLNAYPGNHQFQHQSIYYDAKADPVKHFNAFLQLARVCQQNGIRGFNCFPLRRSWSPCYMEIDTK
ncbi:hypothetical protein BX666DRAFT_1812039, partial [Dichotomocladium elegans]